MSALTEGQYEATRDGNLGGVIQRPEVTFDAVQHAYEIKGEKVLGVSTIAKVGGVDDAWGIASAWGFRVGYEGAYDLFSEVGPMDPQDGLPWDTKDELRADLKRAGLTPWAKRDKAAERGSWVHDLLEDLGQDGTVPDMDAFREEHGEEAFQHARSIMKWFLHLRPKFVAMEVQVASEKHGFAGRYDLRALIEAKRLVPCLHPLRTDPQAVRVRELAERGEWALGLLDLKTSKSVYPTTHFPQLEGYEGGGVEMGFPATDFRAVINTNADGSFDPSHTKKNAYGDDGLGDFVISWATYDDFLAFVPALRALRRIKAADPFLIAEKAREEFILAQLPAMSRDLAKLGAEELAGLDTKAIGRILGGLRKRGTVTQDEKTKTWEVVA